MATFQCQQCGNLHGAPTTECGVCRSPAVMQVPDDTPAPKPPLAGPQAPPPPAAATAAATTDEFLKVFGPLFEEGFDYVRARDRERVQREFELDEKENVRRERVTVAKLGLFSDLVALAESLNQLAQAATEYIKARQAVPPSPVVE